MGLFSKNQKSCLKQHLYISEGSSLCEPYMQVVWNWMFKMVPATWAPNCLTLAGLLANILTTLIMIHYNPDGKREVSGWVYLVCATGVFTYQVLDALDGKQSRRTRDGPPEEILDHGCDSISTVCVLLACCFAMKLGEYPKLMLFQLCLSELCCYMSIWQKFVTGAMCFSKIDVTEGQLMAMMIHIICAISPYVFNTTVPVFNTTLRYLCVSCSIAGSIIFVLKQLQTIMKGRVSKDTSSVQSSSTISPIIPIGLAIGFQMIVAMTTSVYTDLPCLYLITFGLITSKITVRLIVATVTKDKMPLFDWIFVGPILLLTSQLMNSVFPEPILLVCVCIYSIQNWIFYFWKVIVEICEHLNIYCFNVTSRPYPELRMATG